MKLRNKKTGEIRSIETIIREAFIYNNLDSLKNIDASWEEPKEPLIKDQKIRKAVRAWAEANDYPRTMELYYNAPNFVLRSDISIIEFDKEIEPLQHGDQYTITELCGEDEE